LVVAGAATILLLLAMSPADERMKDSGGPGIVPLELSGGQDRAEEILAEWGEEGQDAARESLWIDFGFLLAYGTFLTLALSWARERAATGGWRRLTRAGPFVAWFGAIGAACDAVENTFLLLTLDGAGAAAPHLATIFAVAKFAFLAAAIAYLLAVLAVAAQRAMQRA
jgi:hypothetical protein